MAGAFHASMALITNLLLKYYSFVKTGFTVGRVLNHGSVCSIPSLCANGDEKKKIRIWKFDCLECKENHVISREAKRVWSSLLIQAIWQKIIQKWG